MSATVASCQGPIEGTLGGLFTERSVALVALFEPGVAAVVVAADFPKAGFVVVEDAETGDPLGALPKIEVGDKQPGGSAVVASQWLSVDLERDPCLAAGDVI